MRILPDIGSLADHASRTALAGLDIAHVTADSRRVGPGDLFVAVPGVKTDGRGFIGEAVRRGAAAVLAPEGTVWPADVPARPLILDREPRRSLARLAALLAGPQPPIIAAVTGTNGKTSSVEFLRQIWTANRHRAASIGTLGLIAEGFDPGPGLTTPDPVSLAETLAALNRAGIGRVAMEASSHGLDQFRLDGVTMAGAIFTNLTRDHLDYHGTLEAYRRAKSRLFEDLLPEDAPVVAHADMDAATLAALREISLRRGLQLMTVGEGGDHIALRRVTPLPEGQALIVEHEGTRREIMLPLPGRFQVDNAIGAAALAGAFGDPAPLCKLSALTGVRGRMELAVRLPNGAAVYVDFAHTPDALERLLTALRPHTSGRLLVVFGAGGDRDRGKRPLMGDAAARLADIAIVTDDNPRSEDPATIRAAIRAACPAAIEVGDRVRAIETGLNLLRPGDVLAVAGKGHEQGQMIGGTVIPFDDVSVVRSLAGAA